MQTDGLMYLIIYNANRCSIYHSIYTLWPQDPVLMHSGYHTLHRHRKNAKGTSLLQNISESKCTHFSLCDTQDGRESSENRSELGLKTRMKSRPPRLSHTSCQSDAFSQVSGVLALSGWQLLEEIPEFLIRFEAAATPDGQLMRLAMVTHF